MRCLEAVGHSIRLNECKGPPSRTSRVVAPVSVAPRWELGDEYAGGKRFTQFKKSTLS
jgi:hypothetical protein